LRIDRKLASDSKARISVLKQVGLRALQIHDPVTLGVAELALYKTRDSALKGVEQDDRLNDFVLNLFSLLQEVDTVGGAIGARSPIHKCQLRPDPDRLQRSVLVEGPLGSLRYVAFHHFVRDYLSPSVLRREDCGGNVPVDLDNQHAPEGALGIRQAREAIADDEHGPVLVGVVVETEESRVD
jgi:hypothetical protein